MYSSVAMSSPDQTRQQSSGYLRHLALSAAQHVVDLVVGALQVAGAAHACQVGAPPGVTAQEGCHLHTKPAGAAAHCLGPGRAAPDAATLRTAITCCSLRVGGGGDKWKQHKQGQPLKIFSIPVSLQLQHN